MKISNLLLASICLLLACNTELQESTPTLILPDNDSDNGSILLPEKFGAIVFADDLGRGRHLAINDNGDIYVHLRAENKDSVAIIGLRDTDGDGKADMRKGFSRVTGTGIEIYDDHLYYADNTTVYRSPLSEGELMPGEQVDTIAQMVEGKGHMAKTFTFDGQGNMYVNVGSASNACQQEARSKGSPGVDPCVELDTRAGIWKFDADELQQQQAKAVHYATGIRNGMALSWNQQTNKLYFVSHGRDDLHRFWPDKFTEDQNVELPAEEFHMVTSEGQDFGWPYCYYNQFEGKRYLNPEYGGDGSITDRCQDQALPIIGFPGHWAPNDILFYTGDQFPARYKNGAFIAFHGSWNRLNHQQAGFKVVFVPFVDGKFSSNYEIFADAFVGPQPIKNPSDAKYRPCGLAQGSDGSLYILDSQLGRLWRVSYYAEGLPITPVISDEVADVAEETPEAIDPALVPGKKVYDAYCTGCHQTNGKGAPGMNPPLAGTDWVTGDKTRLIRVILNGLSDPVVINGETYQNAMASHAFLSNQQIADVLTYIRQSFGNDAEAVTSQEVAQLREVN